MPSKYQHFLTKIKKFQTNFFSEFKTEISSSGPLRERRRFARGGRRDPRPRARPDDREGLVLRAGQKLR